MVNRHQPAEPVVCIFRVKVPVVQELYLSGSFNNWSVTAAPMESKGSDLWEIAVPLQPGCYRYCYVGMLADPAPEVAMKLVVVHAGHRIDVPGQQSLPYVTLN